MKLEHKQLLFEDLCAKFPHGVMVSVQGGEFDFYKYPYQLTAVSKFGLNYLCKVYHPIYTPFGIPRIEEIKPYLRPMSSMTEEEREEYRRIAPGIVLIDGINLPHIPHVDWLNKKMLDYRGLIPIGLALEAPEGMYK